MCGINACNCKFGSCNLCYEIWDIQSSRATRRFVSWLSSTIMDVSTLLDWQNAVMAVDTKRISAIMSIHQTIVSESLTDIPQDLNIPAKLGDPSTMSALQYTLLTMWSYNNDTSANEKQISKARKHLVDLLLQVCIFKGKKKDTSFNKLPPPILKLFFFLAVGSDLFINRPRLPKRSWRYCYALRCGNGFG